MIKRLLWLVVALVCVARSANAQQGLQGYVVTGTGAQARIVLIGSAIVFHQLTWNVTGTVSGCTVALDTSADGVSWSAGNAIAGQTCTSNGQSALSTSAVFNFVRVNTTAFSGTGSVVITWAGYVATPGGLPTGCTSPGTGAITCTGTVAANALTSTTSLSTGSGASGCGAGTVGCNAYLGGAVSCTPTAGQACQRYDSATKTFLCSLDIVAEGSCSPPGVVLVPTTTVANEIAPTANNVVGLTVVRTTGTTGVDVFDVCDSLVATVCTGKVLYVDNNENVQTSNSFIAGNAIGTNTKYNLVTNVPFAFVAVPTIAGAGCGGSAATIPATPNGTISFTINVGTAPTAGGCTITMPAAVTTWNCFVNDITTTSTGVFHQKQTGAASTTSVTLQNFSDVAVATAPTANDIYQVSCFAR